MKKIAILNDIHGNCFLLEKALDELRKRDIDYYLIGGDYLTDGPDGDKLIDIIKDLPGKVINGNRELTIIEYAEDPKEPIPRHYPMYYTYKSLNRKNIDFIVQKKIFEVFTIEGKKICLSHGSPYNVRDLVYPNQTDLLDSLIEDFDSGIYLFAHTHETFHTVYRGRHFINAGAINLPNDSIFNIELGILTIDKSDITYEQLFIPFEFEEYKSYYLASDYYRECYIWTNIILHSAKSGVDYANEFAKEYDENKSYQDNFEDFMNNHNLDVF